MQISIEEVEVRLVADAIDSEVLTTGRLMSPAEVRAHVYSDGSSVDSRAYGWVLCGDVHPDMYKTLRSGAQLQSSIGTMVGKAGTRFLVVQQTAGNWAHRILLPLMGDIACNLARRASSEGFLTSLSASRESEAIVQKFDFAITSVTEAQHQEVHMLKNPHGFASDLITATLVLLKPKALPSAGTEAIEHVCVTTVASEDVIEYLALLNKRGTGQQATTH